jgi:hypothetical protein
VDLHPQVGAVAHRLEIALGGAGALATVDREVRRTESLVLRAVEILRHRVATTARRLHQRVEDDAVGRVSRDGQRPPAAVKARGAAPVRLGTRKQPITSAKLSGGGAGAPPDGADGATVEHAVDRGRAAEQLAARQDDLAHVRMQLRLSG